MIEITNTKHEFINIKSNYFGHLVIGIWNLFEI